MDEFSAGENAWTERLGNLRNTVRQELIGRHLDDHVRDGAAVADIGCGQGTQAIRLARRGCNVTGVDPSAQLLARCAADADVAGVAVDLRQGHLQDLDAVLGDRTFEVVCAHGVLMYLDDPTLALDLLSDRVAPGGLLSVTFRNGDALAFRPGMRGQWQAAVEAMDAATYVNELGVRARSDRLENITGHLIRRGMSIDAWYGVRIFTDATPSEERGDRAGSGMVAASRATSLRPRPVPAPRLPTPRAGTTTRPFPAARANCAVGDPAPVTSEDVPGGAGGG